jgi:light-regulated signal transduction histidine kinase (bacteriophytochrome)
MARWLRLAEESVLAVVLAHSNELMGLVSAEGAAWRNAGQLVTCGRTPPPPLIQEIAAWVEERQTSRPFHRIAGRRVPSCACSQ